MATTSVSVEPKGTIPLTGGAQGPFPCCISIQQSTLSPRISNKINNKFIYIKLEYHARYDVLLWTFDGCNIQHTITII